MRRTKQPLRAVPDGVVERRPKRTQIERSAEARAILIDIAIQQIREKGFAYVTMAEIADRAGMTRGAIQHHFGARDDYMREVLEALTNHVAARLAAQPPDECGSEETLVKRCVDTLGRIVLSREQLAVTDISISSRAVPALRADSDQISRRMTQIYSDAWHRWLDGRYPDAAIRKAFVIFSVFFSGVLAINYGRREAGAFGEQVALCTELVAYALAGGDPAPRPLRP